MVTYPLIICSACIAIVVILQLIAICLLYYRIESLDTSSAFAQNNYGNIGTTAPDFEGLVGRNQEKLSSNEIKGTDVYILFISTGCQSCTRIVRELSLIGSIEKIKGLRVLAICVGNIDYCNELLDELPRGFERFSYIQSDLLEGFGLIGVPSLVEMDKDWTITNIVYPGGSEEIIDILETRVQAKIGEDQILG